MTILTAHTVLAGSATWKLSPGGGGWNSASHWTPGTVPNGSADTATFASSNVTNVSFSTDTQVNGIVFNAAASAFTITAGGPGANFTFTLSGVGVTNNSGVAQNFFVGSDENSNPAHVVLSNSAAAGQNTRFTVDGGFLQFQNSSTAQGAVLITKNNSGAAFSNDSSASSASITNEGGTAASFSGYGGYTFFEDSATAGSAMIMNNAQQPGGSSGGQVQFDSNSSAGTATFVNHGGVSFAGGYVAFNGNSTAGTATFLNEGGIDEGGAGGFVEFNSDATANSAVITNSGGSASEAQGGATQFFVSSTAGTSTLIANAGTNGGNGGRILFRHQSTGGTSRIKVFGNGELDISLHETSTVTIGSLEGSGSIFVGAQNLIVGSNALDTAFSGMIQDGGAFPGVGGSLTKIGSGMLTFQGGATNNYIGDTVSLAVAAGSTINLNFTGTPDTIRSLVAGGVAQAPGLYGSMASGAPNQLPQFTGPGQVLVTMLASSRVGGFGVDLPLSGSPGIECRSGGANNIYQIVVTFLNPVTVDNASVTSGTGMVTNFIGSGTTTVTVNLHGVSNAQTIKVTLFGVNDGTGTHDITIPMSILIGDTNGNGTVNSTDISQTKLRSGQTIGPSNFRSDVNGNGVINATDVSLVKLKSGTSLP